MATIRFPPNQHFVMKPHVIKFAEGMEEYFGGAMNWGTYNGHSPPEGPTQALDHFNPNSAAGHRQQDKAAEWAIAHAKEYGLRYVIKRLEIWNIERAAEGWRRRSATGNQTADHLDHNHYTFYASAPDFSNKPKEDDMKGSIIGWVYEGQDYWVDRLAGTSFVTGTDAQIKAVLAMGALQLGTVDKSVHDLLNTTYKAGFDG